MSEKIIEKYNLSCRGEIVDYRFIYLHFENVYDKKTIRLFLEKFFVFEDPNAKYTWAYKQGKWDGNIEFYKVVNENKNLYKTTYGLRNYIKYLGIKIINEPETIRFEILENQKIKIFDNIINNFRIEDLSYLRDYQFSALIQILKNEIGCISMPTGSGKTLIPIALYQVLRFPILYIIHSKDLLYQTYNKFSEFFDKKDIGLVGDSNFDFKKITIAIWETLYKRKVYPKNFEILIIDEAHRLPSKCYSQIVSKIPSRFRIAMSGSLFKRKDGRDLFLFAQFGGTIYKINFDYLSEENYILKPDIYIVKIPFFNNSNIKIQKFKFSDNFTIDYHNLYEEEIVNNLYRNRKIAEISKLFYEKNKRILIFVRRIEHGKILKDLIKNDFGIQDVLFVSGLNSKYQRQKAIEILKKKAFIIIVTNIFEEGIDIPSLDVVINAGAGKSEISLLQKLGRLTRKTEGKENAIYIDFYDLSYIFKRQSEERINALKNQNFKIRIFDENIWN